jgi:ankyrin repeat protein
MASSSKIRLRLTLAIWLISAVAPAQSLPDPFLAGDISMARSQLEAHVPKYPAAELTHLAEVLGRSNNVARAVQQAVIRDDFTNTAALLAQFPGTPDDIDFAGESLLLNQANRDKPEIMKLLLDHKVDPNRANSSGETALLRAIQNGHFDAALMLLDAGADAVHTNSQGASALGMMVRFNWSNAKPGVVDRLLQKLLDGGADAFGPFDNESRLSILEQSFRSMNPSVANLLLTNRPAVDRRTPQGDTALHLAVEWNRTNAVDFLLAHGFSIDQTNSEGLTPLQIVAQAAMSRPTPAPNFGTRVTSMVRGPRTVPMQLSTGTGPVQISAPGIMWGVPADTIKAAWLLDRGAMLDVWSAAALGRTNELAAMLGRDPPLANSRDGLGRTPLHYAALASQLGSARLLVRAGAGLALRTTKPIRSVVGQFGYDPGPIPAGSTALQLASLRDDGAMLQLLLRCGASAELPDDDGNLPLHAAARNWTFFPQTNCAWMLVNLPVPLDATNHDGRSALRLAIESGKDRIAELLLSAGARQDVGLATNTLLHIAAAQGNAGTISNLLKHGRNVNERDAAGSTAFLCAANSRQAATMKYLLANGADVNAADNRGDTALHLATGQQFDTLGFFIDLPWLKRWEQKWLGQPGIRRTVVTNLIHWKILSPPPVMTWTNESLSVWLIEHHANPNLTNQLGQTPLHFLLEQNWLVYNSHQVSNRVAALLKAGARLDIKDAKGRTPIHLAAMLPGPSVLSLLAPLATNLDSMLDSEGRTPLHYAATVPAAGYRPFAETNAAILLTRGANPNLPDKYGLTPLHIAVTNRADQRLAIVSLLLNNHADPNARDALGRAPLHLLARSVREGDYFSRGSETVEALMQAGADPALLDDEGQTILHRWCDQGRVHSGNVDQILRQFLTQHTNLVNLTNAAGDTPLHLALRSRDFSATQSLMNHGADPAIRNAQGETAYLYAAKALNGSTASQVRPRGVNFGFAFTISTRNKREFDAWLDADTNLAKITFDNGETSLQLATRPGIPRAFADRLLSLGAPLDLFSALRLGRMADFRRLAAGTNRLSLALLTEAVRLGRFEEIEDLAAASTELRAADSEGHTLLFYTHAGQSNIAVWLREHGVTQTVFDAAAGGDTNFLGGVLPTNRALASATNSDGQSLLMLAARHGQADAARLLIAQGAEIDTAVNGCTPLMFACARGATDIAAALLAAGANPDVRQPNGLAPLHLAAIGGHTSTVAVLLDRGVNPDQVQTNRADNYPTMPEGSTALHWAANWGRTEVVALLLQRGASVRVTNDAGDSPLDVVPTDARGNTFFYSPPPRTGFPGRPGNMTTVWREVEAALDKAGATRKKI